MLFAANILPVIFIAWYQIKPGAILRTNFTGQPLLGHRCELSYRPSQTTLLNTSRAQCVWRCLSTDSCVVVSYNHMLSSYELSVQLCDSVVPNADLSINVYGMNRKLCSHWVSQSGYDPQRAVLTPIKTGSTTKLAVVRKQVNSGLYPGKRIHNRVFISVVINDDTVVKDDRGEILLVDSACLWKWIPYTPPNILPVGAVDAGYDFNKEPLYVARAIFGTIYSLGYYKSSKMLGYFIISSKVTKTNVIDILVIL